MRRTQKTPGRKLRIRRLKFKKPTTKYADKGRQTVVAKASEMGTKEFCLAGLKWRLSTLRYQGGDSDLHYIAVRLEPLIGEQMLDFQVKIKGVLRIPYCLSKITSIAYDVQSGIEQIEKEFCTVFRPSCSYYVDKKFVPISNVGTRSPLTDWEARFNVDLDMEVHLVAISQFPMLNFGIPSPSKHQICVKSVKGDERSHNFYVDKGILAQHSDYFKTMLLKPAFAESDNNRTEYDCISPKGFLSFLHVLHSSPEKMTSSVVAEILGFARMTFCSVVIGHCENFLQKEKILTLAQKLQLADHPHSPLVTLMADLIKKLKTQEDVENVLEATRLQGKKKLILQPGTISQLERRKEQLPSREALLIRRVKKMESKRKPHSK